MTDRCPPHNFKAAWASEDRGVLFCSLCGDIRELDTPAVEAPTIESSPIATKEDKSWPEQS